MLDIVTKHWFMLSGVIAALLVLWILAVLSKYLRLMLKKRYLHLMKGQPPKKIFPNTEYYHGSRETSTHSIK